MNGWQSVREEKRKNYEIASDNLDCASIGVRHVRTVSGKSKKSNREVSVRYRSEHNTIECLLFV